MERKMSSVLVTEQGLSSGAGLSILRWAHERNDQALGNERFWNASTANSLVYLPIAEATVITFLAPIVACFVCSFVINEPFTRAEQIAGLISLCGVVLIARPATLFSRDDSDISPVGSGGADTVPITNSTISGASSSGLDAVTPAKRLVAIVAALIGVVGAAGAYTTIRWIGKRAHPLISVNYFASWCTVVSATETHLQQQILLTSGLQYEKSSRATNMVYTQMLFALAFDKIVWGHSPGIISIVGSSLILGSAIYVALRREHASQKKSAAQNTVAAIADEERALVEGMDDVDDEHEQTGGVEEMQLRTMRP
ncbi:hypothetical protein GP486_002369 [Trichoglossum hirsutum]|uniref:EamA domain-containing protein n=1 Tax=Trichoglossum hirsutum TaxID=265104 RepID=A0A9P8RS55_9PEZI|nr:hypothetical protein GP486_002369 [Trichoglossum hirsutum]